MTDSTKGISDSAEEILDQRPDPEFIECLEQEAELVKTAIGDGATPMIAHARTLVWLDTLVKIHAVGLDQALNGTEVTQAATWSRDLAALELALALVQNVKPLNSTPQDS